MRSSVGIIWDGVGYVFFCQHDVGWCWVGVLLSA